MREFKVRSKYLTQYGVDIVYVHHEKDFDQANWDSKLIAAAPELLDIVNRIIFEFSEMSDIRTEYQWKVLQDAVKLVGEIEGNL